MGTKEAKAEVYDSLVSKNERLMAEMNQYLATFTDSPGGDTIDSNETTKTHNHSSISYDVTKSSYENPDDAKSSLEKSTINSSHNEVKAVTKGKGSGRNLIPIDEASPSSLVCEVDHDSLGTDDDDSLVQMAKGMDDASIVSESTVFREFDKTFSASAPLNGQKQKITSGMKKLGQKISQNRKSSTTAKHQQLQLPRSTPRNTQQQIMRHNDQQQLANPRNGGVPAKSSTRRLSGVDARRGDSPSSSASPSSTKENVDYRLAKYNGVDGRQVHSDSANSSGYENNEGFLVSNESVDLGMRVPGKSTHIGGDNSSSDIIAYEGSGSPGRQESRKKNKKLSIPSNMVPVSKGQVRRGGGASVSSDEDIESTPDNKVTTKSRRKSKSQRRKSGQKKGKEKTRLDCDSNTDDSMQGIGFNTRIHPSPKSSQIYATKKSNEMMAQTTYTDSQHESSNSVGSDGSESDVYSAYDSDEETQIFYESTDDDEFDSDDELMGVGTSVSDAVKDLNNKRAVTKVKNLFGIRR